MFNSSLHSTGNAVVKPYLLYLEVLFFAIFSACFELSLFTFAPLSFFPQYNWGFISTSKDTKKMTISEFEKWSRFASDLRDKAIAGEIQFEQYYADIRK